MSKTITVDGNYAAAHVAYAMSEVSAIVDKMYNGKRHKEK